MQLRFHNLTAWPRGKLYNSLDSNSYINNEQQNYVIVWILIQYRHNEKQRIFPPAC